jgi:hypothetical protein
LATRQQPEQVLAIQFQLNIAFLRNRRRLPASWYFPFESTEGVQS